jgi:hypothetical protein
VTSKDFLNRNNKFLASVYAKSLVHMKTLRIKPDGNVVHLNNTIKWVFFQLSQAGTVGDPIMNFSPVGMSTCIAPLELLDLSN